MFQNALILLGSDQRKRKAAPSLGDFALMFSAERLTAATVFVGGQSGRGAADKMLTWSDRLMTRDPFTSVASGQYDELSLQPNEPSRSWMGKTCFTPRKLLSAAVRRR